MKLSRKLCASVLALAALTADAALAGKANVTTPANKHYSGVIQQQGRVPLDSDFNEHLANVAGLPLDKTEWKYVSVRRITMLLQASLTQQTQWVVFEPNDGQLCPKILLKVDAFMTSLYRQGAFQGLTPQEAYFVKCERNTAGSSAPNANIVNIVVGFAAVRPAEFTVIRIQQLTGGESNSPSTHP